MADWKNLVVEWLQEYASLQENEIKSFAAEHEHNHEIATAIFKLLYNEEESDHIHHCASQIEEKYEQVSF